MIIEGYREVAFFVSFRNKRLRLNVMPEIRISTQTKFQFYGKTIESLIIKNPVFYDQWHKNPALSLPNLGENCMGQEVVGR